MMNLDSMCNPNSAPGVSRTMRYLLAIAVAASIALGQEAGHAVISGAVVEASNGEPVRKAIVTLTLQGRPRRWATARTDSSGQFTFAGLPAGKYDLRAAMQDVVSAWGPGAVFLEPGSGYILAENYADGFYGASGEGRLGGLISLEEGETRGGLKLLFTRPGSITGRVFEPDGEPAANVSVTVFGKLAPPNWRSMLTDDRGQFRFIGVDPGDYCLLALPRNENGKGLLTAQYYGGRGEWKGSTVLHIRGGESLTGVDFHLTTEQPHAIRGHVTGVPAPGSSPEKVLITLGDLQSFLPPGVNWGPSAQIRLAAGPDYSFDFGNLSGGIYRVDASLTVGDKLWAASQLVDTRLAGGDVILPLTRAIDINGQLHIEGAGEGTKSGVEVRLARAGSRGISGRPGADGSFTLKQVPAGEWVINLDRLPAGAFLKSASFGDHDVRFTPLAIGAGSEGPLSIVISTRTAKLTGEVEAGSGDPKRAGILLAPMGPAHNLARFYYGVVSDDSGKFQFARVAPGKYRIFALEKTAPLHFRNPEAADQLGDLGTEIEVTEGAALTVHPKLIPAERALEALNREVPQ